MDITLPPLLTVPQAARLLGISTQAIYKAVKVGSLESYRHQPSGRLSARVDVRIPRRAVHQRIRERQAQQTPGIPNGGV